MKTNQIKTSAQEDFAKSMQLIMARYYQQTLSENVRRGIARKKALQQKLTVTKVK